ncbi:MAG: hypothetical protein IT162_09105 [Bryobacterales bacterium]|nr:hypothetical protein [Bryobacterales bacterium]
MNRGLLLAVAGLVSAAAVVLGSFYLNRGFRPVAHGEIKKIRWHGLDGRSAAAIVDLRIANAGDYAVEVRTIRVEAAIPSAPATMAPFPGDPVAAVDAKRLLAAYPELGPQYNDTLKIRDEIPPRTTLDRMVVARFEVPLAELEGKTRLRILVEDVNGHVAELAEPAPRP